MTVDLGSARSQKRHTFSPAFGLLVQDTIALTARAQDLEASLLRLQRECSQAVAAGQAMVGRPTTPRGSPQSSEDGNGAVTIDDVVRQLIAKLKVRQATLHSLPQSWVLVQAVYAVQDRLLTALEGIVIFNTFYITSLVSLAACHSPSFHDQMLNLVCLTGTCVDRLRSVTALIARNAKTFTMIGRIAAALVAH